MRRVWRQGANQGNLPACGIVSSAEGSVEPGTSYMGERVGKTGCPELPALCYERGVLKSRSESKSS